MYSKVCYFLKKKIKNKLICTNIDYLNEYSECILMMKRCFRLITLALRQKDSFLFFLVSSKLLTFTIIKSELTIRLILWYVHVMRMEQQRMYEEEKFTAYA